MQLQYLNGISLGATQTLFDSVQHQLLHTRADVDSVIGGFDLDNYEGLNTAADTEKLRNYLIRTKRIADQSPALIQSTRNPETFSQMCAYILQYWDTAEREQAALLMAQKEKQLFDHGMIRRVEGDEFGSEFFKALYMMLRPQSEIAGLCGATILRRAKNKLRSSIRTARNNNQDTSSAIASTIRRHRKSRMANTPNLSGVDDPMDELTLCGVVYGLEDEYYGGDETNRRYLTRLHNAIDEAPTLFPPTEREAHAMVSGLGSVLDYWDNAELRDIALTQAQNNPALTQQSSGLFGKLRKALKKIGKGIKKAAQTVGKGVKTAAKAVAKITKKKLYDEGEKDAKEEVADEKAQLKKEGAVEDSTVPAGEIVKTQVTVEVAANAITTTAAASLYESTSSTKVCWQTYLLTLRYYTTRQPITPPSTMSITEDRMVTSRSHSAVRRLMPRLRNFRRLTRHGL